MGDKSKIEWTDATWNPLAGCSLVSSGCAHCYAMRQAAHILRMQPENAKYQGTVQTVNGQAVWTGRVNLDEAALLQPLHWKKARRVFVNSMSDLFHESVPFETIDRVFAVMALAPQHTFQVLTKRAGRMAEYFAKRSWGDVITQLSHEYDRLPAFKHHPLLSRFVPRVRLDDVFSGTRANMLDQHHERKPNRFPQAWPLPNVWLGVSVEDQAAADERIPHLLRTPAAVRFLSCEPLLGAVRLDRCGEHYLGDDRSNPGFINAFNALAFHPLTCKFAVPEKGDADGIHWVIVGGESGPGARPMHPEWARGLRDQCQAAGVPFFFKQWGEWGRVTHYAARGCHHATLSTFSRDDFEVIALPDNEVIRGHGGMLARVGKKAAGRVLDGREWNEYPEAGRHD